MRVLQTPAADLEGIHNADFQRQAGRVNDLAQCAQPLLLQTMLEAALQSNALAARHPHWEHSCHGTCILGSLDSSRKVLQYLTGLQMVIPAGFIKASSEKELMCCIAKAHELLVDTKSALRSMIYMY